MLCLAFVGSVLLALALARIILETILAAMHVRSSPPLLEDASEKRKIVSLNMHVLKLKPLRHRTSASLTLLSRAGVVDVEAKAPLWRRLHLPTHHAECAGPSQRTTL
jgi:hypothetical protein